LNIGQLDIIAAIVNNRGDRNSGLPDLRIEHAKPGQARVSWESFKQ